MAWLSADANANDRVQSPPAQGFENLDRLEQRVAAFARREGGVRDPRVDRRLRLSTCDALPELLWYGAGQTTVLGRCGGPKSWQSYVPVPLIADLPGAARPAARTGNGCGAEPVQAGRGAAEMETGGERVGT